MKILIVGSQKVWALENIYHKHLNQLGNSTEIYPIHDYFYDYYYKSTLNKVLHKIGVSRLYVRLNKRLIDYVSGNCFDIIWVFKGMELFPDTIDRLKQLGSKLVNYNPDHPFMFAGKGSGNKNVINAIGRYDMHFCYHLGIKNKIEKDYNVPCHYLPFGYEPVPLKLPKEDEELLKACFIGNPDKIRINLLQNLIDQGVQIDVYGNQWKKNLKPSTSTRIYPAIYGNGFSEVSPLYRVQINIFRKHNEGSHNMRTFEMPGLGCIMLAPNSPEHENFFNTNEALFYTSVADMKDKLALLLEMSYENARKIRLNAYERSEKSRYSYFNRAMMVISVLQALIKDD